MKQGFVPSGKSRLRVMREGHAVVREWSIPKPMVLVDSREQKPLRLFQRHPNWIGGEQRVALKSCDYSVEGMTELLALERKSLPDIINCTNSDRPRFIRSCERLAKYHWKANLVEASYEDLKTSYEDLTDVETQVHPNAVCGTLDAIEVKFGIPILYTSQNTVLACEKAASWLSKHFTYWWLEQNGHERVLIDSDGL